jgi:hypothetical protein
VAEFSEETKLVVVQLLAQFVRPAQVVEALAEDGIQTDIRQVGGYDPTRPYFEAGDKWRQIFDATRKKFIEELETIPAANRAFRINLLQEAALTARAKGESGTMASMLRQIAEETGGVLTNRREIEVGANNFASLSADEKRAALARIIEQSLAPAAAPTAPAPETVQ